jgi:sugar (pentulose or hexulose) kinase
MSGKAIPAMGVLDLGASGGRFFAVTIENGRMVLDEIHRFEHYATTLHLANRAGGVATHQYWDVFAQYAGLITGLRKAAATGKYRIVSVAVDTWGADGLWINGDGEPMGNIFCYRDHRLDTIRPEIFNIVSERTLFDRTGIPSHPFNVVNQLYWATTRYPKLVEQADMYLPVPSIFSYYLSGQKVIDTSWMTNTQCCTAGQPAYDAEVFSKLKLPMEKMPKIVSPGTNLGPCHKSLADDLGIEPFATIATAGHDTACAFVAAPVTPKVPTLIISSGTWALVGIVLDRPMISDAVFASRFANEGGVEGVRFLNNVMGTWILQELRRIWKLKDGHETSWPEIEKLVADAGPAKSYINPDDLSFYNPTDMAQAIVEFCRKTGQPTPNSRGEILRVAMESLALKTAWACRTVGALTNQAIGAVHIVGGGGKSKALTQFIADATGLVVKTGPYDATAVGNAMVQAVSLGMVTDYNESRQIVAKSFESAEYAPKNVEHFASARAAFEKLL